MKIPWIVFQALRDNDWMPLEGVVILEAQMRHEHAIDSWDKKLVVVVNGLPVPFHKGFEVVN